MLTGLLRPIHWEQANISGDKITMNGSVESSSRHVSTRVEF